MTDQSTGQPEPIRLPCPDGGDERNAEWLHIRANTVRARDIDEYQELVARGMDIPQELQYLAHEPPTPVEPYPGMYDATETVG